MNFISNYLKDKKYFKFNGKTNACPSTVVPHDADVSKIHFIYSIVIF